MCACLDESGLCLSMLIYLLSISCFYFSLDFISPACSCFYFSVLLPLLFQSLVRLASLGSLSFLFGHVSPCSAWPVLRGGLAALCLVSQLSVWSRGALLRRLGHPDASVIQVIPGEVFHSRAHVHCLSTFEA